MISSEELLKNTKNILENEGELTNNQIDSGKLLHDFILPGLKNSKEVLSSIYSFKSRSRGGIFGKVKTFIQNKIIFTTINVIERQSMKQQKFNELTYKAIEALIKENEELKKKITSLESFK